MKSFLALPLIVLGMTSAAWAQNPALAAGSVSSIATAAIDSTPVAQAAPIEAPQAEAAPLATDSFLIAQAVPKPSLAALSFAVPAPAADSVPRSCSRASAAALRLQRARLQPRNRAGLSVIRFSSSVYYASARRFHSSAAFSSRIGWRSKPRSAADSRHRFSKTKTSRSSPTERGLRFHWAQALRTVGSRACRRIARIPQTALGGKNGFQVPVASAPTTG